MAGNSEKNLALIAEQSGVIKMTVRRVLRNQDNVSPQTCRMVLQMAGQMGFVPGKSRGPTIISILGDFT
ncbi:MAG: helix-turn-helix domain-containing protein [Sedimentisphaerales bacterium]|nr:helix-turn-helix domain-containing protein [Sedimentisphaerales bacterium]